jgi:iron complex outermembrane receptor protein
MILLALAGISLPTIAHAADADAPADIIVTSSRQPYRGDFTAQETPAAITIIDSTWLANTNVLRLTDALDLNASVSRQNNFGGALQATRICPRAISSTATTMAAASAVCATWRGSSASRC